MTFYLNVAQKYANIRTFSPEGGTGAGADGSVADAAAAAAAALAAAATEGKPDDAAEAAKAADAAAKATDDAAKAAAAASKDDTKTDAEKAALVREVMERKAKQREAEDKLKQFEGVDVARYRELIAKETQAEQAAAEAKGDFDRVKQMMAEAHKTELNAVKEELEALRATVSGKDKVIDELSIGNAFGTSTYIADALILSPTKTRTLYGTHFEVEDGRVVAYDKPRGSADRTMMVDASGSPLSFNDALVKIIEADPDKNSVLRSKARSGAGSSTEGAKVDKPQKPENQPRGVAAISLNLEKLK